MPRRAGRTFVPNNRCRTFSAPRQFRGHPVRISLRRGGISRSRRRSFRNAALCRAHIRPKQPRRTFSRSPTVPGTSYADKPPPPPGSCRRTPAHLTAEPGRWPISARSETDRNGLFLRLGACLAAADELDDLVQSVGEFRKILLVEEYLVAVVTRCAVGGRDFAALGDGQEIVVAARGRTSKK